MDGTGAHCPQRLVMGLGTVALMYFKTVTGEFLSHFHHQVITGDLSQNGCGCNVGAEAVTLDNRTDRHTKILGTVAVNESQVSLTLQLCNGTFHSQVSSLENIDLINFLMGGKADAIGNRLLFDQRKQLTTLLVSELLGIVQAVALWRALFALQR